MDLVERVRAAIRRHRLLDARSRVLVALSGGPDSVALLHVCRTLAAAGDLHLVGAAHLNHRLRPDADDDAAFCADLARTLGVPFEGGEADVAALAAARRVSVEAAAHDARYAFLRAAGARLGADRLALGHNLDDQAETVLLRLLRGAGARGLAGMHPRRGPFIRPFLETGRAAIRDFLDERGLPFRTDPSNRDPTIPRNRIRAELLPLLAREYNPRIAHRLAQAAELAREQWDWVSIAATSLVADAVQGGDPEWRVATDAIRRAHPAVARAVLQRVLEQAAGGRPIAWAHVDLGLALCQPDAAGQVDLPGQRLERRGRWLVLTSRRGAGTADDPRPGADGAAHAFRYPLAIPGEAAVPESGVLITAAIGRDGVPSPALAGHRAVARLPLDGVAGATWAVRSWRPGDRIALPGGRGRKKLQDLFVDRKVPRAERRRLPIVVDDEDRVVWVPGHALGGDFRVTDPAQAVLVLTLRLLGGRA